MTNTVGASGAINPNDTDVFFDACVPGGGPVGPELENRFYTRKGHFLIMA